MIISTYNKPDTLSLVLLALANQSVSDFEVIIADDGSKAEVRRQIESLQSQLPYKFNYVWQPDDGYRLAMIRNKAVAIASGDYLIFLDGDSVPLPTFVEYHQKLAEEGCFVSGSRVLLSECFTAEVLRDNVEIYKWGKLHWFYARLKNLCNRFSPFILLPYLPNKIRKLRTKKYSGIRGCNLALWKKDLLAVNGFDESYHGWGYEDSDFVIRLIRSGIFRKDGSFMVPVLHLWHLENSRNSERDNYKRLEDTIRSSHVRVEHGVDQYIHRNRSL